VAYGTDEILTKLRRFRDLVKDRFPVHKVLLYGSFAKGLATDQSDIDVAVVIDLPNVQDRLRVGAELFEHSAAIDPAIEPRCVSLEDYENCEPASILAEIKRTAVEIEG
jgi:predicted nucleotidyltransferase